MCWILENLKWLGTPEDFSGTLLTRLLYILLLIAIPIGTFALVIFSLRRIERSWNRNFQKLAKRPIISTVLFILIACYGFAAPMGLPALMGWSTHKYIAPMAVKLPIWADATWRSQCN